MKFKDCQFRPKNRRGLATVVGGLIFIILMVSAFSMLGLAIEYQGDLGQTAKIVANADLKKQQEDFKINIFTDSNQLLTVDVTNIGQNHVEIHTLIITNSTDAANGFPTKVHDILSSSSFVGPGYTGNVVLALPITLKLAQNLGDTELYHFKVISSIGTIKTQSVSCDDTECGAIASAGGGLTATLFLDGPTGVNTKTSTVVMFVSNTADVAITDVQPTAGFTPVMCDDLWFPADDSGATETKFVEDVDPCVVSPSSKITLDPHTSTLFKWDGTILGDVGSVFTFCSAVSGTHPDDGPISSGAPSCDALTVIDPNDCNGCGDPDELVLSDELYGKPRIFMHFPNLLGDSEDGDVEKGFWSVNVANPTDANIYVSKVVITATSPAIAENDNIFIKECQKELESTLPETISPTTDDWFCPGGNQLVWQNIATPQLIEPRSVFSFKVKIGGDVVSGQAGDVVNVVVQPIIFSTLGQFGKAGYGTSMSHGYTAIPNVYLSVNEGSTSDADILTFIDQIDPGELVTFKTVIADMTTSTDWQINDDTKLIINIPRDWTFGSIVSSNGFDTPVYQIFPDGSSQITGELSSGNPITGNNDAETIVFTATAPTDLNTKLYVMHILASGTATGDGGTHAVGPIAETVLQVCGTTGCP